MWDFLAARLWAQRVALLFAVLGLALAIGAFSASWQIFKSVRAGHPIGSNFEGEVFSVLPYISSMQMNFFVDPAQVAALQETAGASLQLLASSGTRAGSVTLDSGEVEVGYEAVSENYFAGLGLRTTPKSWQPTPEPECVVSEAFLKKYGFAAAPEILMINGKSFRVRATVALYQGLFDRNSDIWIPWQHAHSLLFPGFSDQGLLRQPGLYWLIAIAPAGQASSRSLASLARLKNRVDLLVPPWDAIRIAPGITSDLTAHSAADTSSKIYLMGAALMLMVALINLACTTALGRARFVDRELILQHLGVSRAQFLTHTTLLVLVPVVLAMTIAPASAWGFRWFLSQEPNLRAIFGQAPVQQQNWLHATLDPLWLGLALGAVLLGLLLSNAIAYAGGVSAMARSLRASPARLRLAFRLLLGLLAGICAGTLWFGAMVQVRSGAIAEHLAMPAVAQSAVAQADATEGARASESIWLIRLHSAQFDTDTQTAISQSVAAEFSSTAWMQQTPFLTRAPTSGFVLSESDDALLHPALKLQSNFATAGVVTALGLKLLSGRDLQNSDEALLDQIAAAELQKQGKSAIGLRLYDASSTGITVVGVVQNLPFDAEPENAQGMIYLYDRYAAANLLIVRGAAQVAEIERLAAQLTRDFNIKIESSENYQALLARNTQSYRSRALLGLLAASISAGICFFSLISVALLEFAQKRRSLAIYAALGAPLWRRYIFASAGVLAASGIGAGTGLLLMLQYTRAWRDIFMVQPSTMVVAACLAFIVVLGTAMLATASLLVRESLGFPLASVLRQ